MSLRVRVRVCVSACVRVCARVCVCCGSVRVVDALAITGDVS